MQLETVDRAAGVEQDNAMPCDWFFVWASPLLQTLVGDVGPTRSEIAV